MIELLGKDINTVIIAVFCMFKKIEESMNMLRRNIK